MKALELSQLFALPLQSAVRAQSLALQETLNTIEQIGIEGGKAKSFSFRADRTVEERVVDPVTGIAEIKTSVQPIELSIPLLALLPLAPMQLQELNVDFGVEVVDARAEPIKSAVIPSAVVGTTMASSSSIFTALGETNPTTMKVHMRITKERPEGIARLDDLLTDMLAGRPEVAPPVDKIPGVTSRVAELLKERGIRNVADFLTVTEVAAARTALAKTAGVTRARIETWRTKAKGILAGETTK